MSGPTVDGLPDDIRQSVLLCFEELDSVIQGWLRFLRQISLRDKWIYLSG
jgi:hypothetical protein